MPRCLPPLSIRMYPTAVPREPHGDRLSSWMRMHLNHGFRRVSRWRVCRRLTSGMQDGFVDVYSSGSGAAAGLEPGPRKAVRVWRRRTRNRFASAIVVSARCPTRASTARDAVRLCSSHMHRAVYPGRGQSLWRRYASGERCLGIVRSFRRISRRQIAGYPSEGRLHHLRCVRIASKPR